jgi:hypothetical protein
MYFFYADESGFSKSNKYESEQPILVVAGIIVNDSKLNQSIEAFDNVLAMVNSKLKQKIYELKFSDIRNKNPFRTDLPQLSQRADLLEDIFKELKQRIDFKLLYCAIDNDLFFKFLKRDKDVKTHFRHPYLYASYNLINQLNSIELVNTDDKILAIFDEQNQFKEDLEKLVYEPIHVAKFNKIFDTIYFGKSHYSKLIQIADLAAGLLRYYFNHKNNIEDFYYKKVKAILQELNDCIIHKNNFNGLWENMFEAIEIHL